MIGTVDPLALSRALIRCPSITPTDAGALDVLEGALTGLGFACRRLPFSAPGTPDVDNLYARLGSGPPNFCYAGHIDVVPVGDHSAWSVDPFAAEVRDGRLYGRGAADMKCAIACFVAAATRFTARHGRDFGGSISLLITGDEEGVAINGTAKMLGWLAENGERLDACVVGEPTNPQRLGEMIKIGRRGSLTGRLTVFGTQGHTAYPQLADNPLPRLVSLLAVISSEALDAGTAHFQPSNLQLTSIDVGNAASNVIPARGRATFNIRFNDRHTGASLEKWLRERCAAVGGRIELAVEVSGEAFLTEPGPLSAVATAAIESVTGIAPEFSTTGGTSDARFIKDHCPVVEFGMINATAHKIDEYAELTDIALLADVYDDLLERFFAKTL